MSVEETVCIVLLLLVLGILVYGYRIAEPFESGLKAKEPNPEVRPVIDLKAAQDARIVCPHCQTRGRVRTQLVKLKKGVSGGKVVASVLTSGLSLLAVGLSRKEVATEARCSNCGSVWHFG